MACRRAVSLAFLVPLFAVAGTAGAADGRLRGEDPGRSHAAVQRQLAELAVALGHASSEERLARFEEDMRPMHVSLPKGEDGGLDQGVVRYALHRFFLGKRGWHIQGLAPDGQRLDASTSMEMLRPKLPPSIIELLEGHGSNKRMGLRELALLAATVEDVVHSDTLELLLMAYETHGLSVDEPLEDEEQFNAVFQTYMAFFVLPWTKAAKNKPNRILKFLSESVHTAYPGWADTMLWVEDLKEAIKHEDRVAHNPFVKENEYFRDFASVVRLAEETINKYGLFQDMECRDIKSKLLALEDESRNDGRVALGKFYGPAYANESFFFTEDPEYLKHLGALDDTDPQRPSVIVPNIIYGRTNCLANTDGAGSFGSVCCVNQCGRLMESLEQGIAHPVASPDLVAKLVAVLPSDTVSAPRKLSDSLRRKLDIIAEQNGGSVPLHGRLFAQWMHHAFPNECPYSHASGVLEAPMSNSEWKKIKNASSMATPEVMKRFVDLVDPQVNVGALNELHEAALERADWGEEELLPGHALQSSRRESKVRTVLRFLAMVGSVVSLAGILLESLSKSSSSLSLQASRMGAISPGSLPSWKSHFV